MSKNNVKINNKLLAVIAVVLVVLIVVFTIFVLKNNKPEEENHTTETTESVVDADWEEAAIGFVYNSPSYLDFEKSAWIPPVYGGFIFQLIDFNFDEIPEILVYTHGVSGATFLYSVFSFDGEKYVKNEIAGFSPENADGMGLISVYIDNESGEYTFWAGEHTSALFTSDDMSKYQWSTFKNYYISREFSFENGVLRCTEHDKNELLSDVTSMTLDDVTRFAALEKARKEAELFEKKYSPAEEYKNICVDIYYNDEFKGDKEQGVLDIYHSYVNETFAKDFIKGYKNGEHEITLPVNVVTWEDGVEYVISNANEVLPKSMMECYVIKYKLIDMNNDKVPEIFVHSVSTAGGANYLACVCVWDGETYKSYPLDETEHGEVMFCKDNKTGENLAIIGVIDSEWLKSDNIEDYNQAWRWEAHSRKISLANDQVKFEEITNLEEVKSTLGDFAENANVRKNSLEKLRTEVETFEKTYTKLESDSENVSFYVCDVFSTQDYYDNLEVDKIQELIDGYKTIVK